MTRPLCVRHGGETRIGTLSGGEIALCGARVEIGIEGIGTLESTFAG